MSDSWNSWDNRSRQRMAPMSGLMLSQCHGTCRPLSTCLTPLLAAENIKKQRNGVWDSWNKLGKNATVRTNGLQRSYQRQGQPQDYRRRSSYLLLILCRHIPRAPCYRNIRIDTMQTTRTADNAGNFDGRHWEEYKHRCCWAAKIHWWLLCTRTPRLQIPRAIQTAPHLRKVDIMILTSIAARSRHQNTNVDFAPEDKWLSPVDR